MTKTIKIIFTISILFNITLLGFVGAGYYKMQRWHQPPLTVTGEARHVLQQNMHASKETMRERFKEVRKHNKELKNIISAEKFDRDAYDTVIQTILNVKNTAAYQKADVLGDTLEELSQEEREKFARQALRMISGKLGHKKNANHRKGKYYQPVQ